MSDEKLIVANAFGGEFPVCTEKDKVAIEAAFKSALEWIQSKAGLDYDNEPKVCMCEMIARLLNGTASYGDQVTLGIDLAREIYLRKMTAVAMAEILGGSNRQHEPWPEALDSDKKWVH